MSGLRNTWRCVPQSKWSIVAIPRCSPSHTHFLSSITVKNFPSPAKYASSLAKRWLEIRSKTHKFLFIQGMSMEGIWGGDGVAGMAHASHMFKNKDDIFRWQHWYKLIQRCFLLNPGLGPSGLALFIPGFSKISGYSVSPSSQEPLISEVGDWIWDFLKAEQVLYHIVAKTELQIGKSLIRI